MYKFSAFCMHRYLKRFLCSITVAFSLVTCRCTLCFQRHWFSLCWGLHIERRLQSNHPNCGQQYSNKPDKRLSQRCAVQKSLSKQPLQLGINLCSWHWRSCLRLHMHLFAWLWRKILWKWWLKHYFSLILQQILLDRWPSTFGDFWRNACLTMQCRYCGWTQYARLSSYLNLLFSLSRVTNHRFCHTRL